MQRSGHRRWGRAAGQHARLQLALLPLLLHPQGEASTSSTTPPILGSPPPPPTLTNEAERAAYCATAAFLGGGLASELADPDTVLAAADVLGRLADGSMCAHNTENPGSPVSGPYHGCGGGASGGVRAALQHFWPLWLRAAAWHAHAAGEAVRDLLPLLVRGS